MDRMLYGEENVLSSRVSTAFLSYAANRAHTFCITYSLVVNVYVSKTCEASGVHTIRVGRDVVHIITACAEGRDSRIVADSV